MIFPCRLETFWRCLSGTTRGYNLAGHLFYYEYEGFTHGADGPSWLFCHFQNDQLEYMSTPNPCVVPTGATESSDGIQFSVVPNPFYDHFAVQTRSGQAFINARLFDLSGRLWLTINASGGQQIDLSGLPPGMYLLKIAPKKGAEIQFKMVKNR